MSVWVLAAVSVLLVTACWTDLRKMKIPNELTALFAVSGFLFHGVADGGNGLRLAVVGALTGFLPLYVMNRFGGIGGGDVKWFGAFGAWAGPMITFQLLILSIVIAGGIACVLLLLRFPGLQSVGRKMKWPWGKHPLAAGKGVRFPFMLAVAPGFMTLLGKG
ncbi:A24 family peptidase [Cohnella mopanensis]|uniref:A24 family peptidase n=1 Tax=Cohnella mopanensis TaxID=2911966 RepID=UPI001EF96608|nr:A24 family peptidase [Cohnella mopanensis]